MNPLASKEVGDSSMERFFRTNDNIKIDLSKFHGRLQPEEFLDWLSAIKKLFEYKEITRRPKSKINYYKASRLCFNLVEQGARDAFSEREDEDFILGEDEILAP
ncbi:unnamed protein product [Musa textilis]